MYAMSHAGLLAATRAGGALFVLFLAERGRARRPSSAVCRPPIATTRHSPSRSHPQGRRLPATQTALPCAAGAPDEYAMQRGPVPPPPVVPFHLPLRHGPRPATTRVRVRSLRNLPHKMTGNGGGGGSQPRSQRWRAGERHPSPIDVGQEGRRPRDGVHVCCRGLAAAAATSLHLPSPGQAIPLHIPLPPKRAHAAATCCCATGCVVLAHHQPNPP